MAQSRASTSPASRSYRRQALLWLMMALLLGVVTALVWMFSQTSAIGAQINSASHSRWPHWCTLFTLRFR